MESSPSGLKRLLVITYYWPPAGGPGVQRIVRFCKYFEQFGYEPIVLTVQQPQSSAYDYELLAQIEGKFTVVKTKSLEPFSLYKRLSGRKSNDSLPKDILQKPTKSPFQKLSKWFRSNLFVPDARVGWKPYLMQTGSDLIEKYHCVGIFSTAPPHSVHLGAMALAKKYNLPWVADFRDPWTDAYWLSNLNQINWASQKNSSLEKKVLSNANAITTVSDELASLFDQKAPNQYHVLHNGYETAVEEQLLRPQFTLLFIGNYTQSLDYLTLINALKTLAIEGIDLEFEVVGSINPLVKQELQASGIKLKVSAYMNHAAMLTYASSAHLMFLPLIDGLNYSAGIVSSKTFDYLAIRRPIAAVGPIGGIAHRILNHTQLGQLFDFGDSKNLAAYIKSIYNLWKTKKPLVSPDLEALDAYSTKASVNQLCKIFDSLNKT